MFHLFWAQMAPTVFNFNVKSFPGTFFSVTGSINLTSSYYNNLSTRSSSCITQEINMIGLTKSGFIMVINAIFPVGINEAILNTKSMHRIQLLFGYFSLLTTFLSLIFGTI